MFYAVATRYMHARKRTIIDVGMHIDMQWDAIYSSNTRIIGNGKAVGMTSTLYPLATFYYQP